MTYTIMVAGGLVLTLIGPFKTKVMAKKWAEGQLLKEYVIIPILAAGEMEEGEG